MSKWINLSNGRLFSIFAYKTKYLYEYDDGSGCHLSSNPIDFPTNYRPIRDLTEEEKQSDNLYYDLKHGEIFFLKFQHYCALSIGSNRLQECLKIDTSCYKKKDIQFIVGRKYIFRKDEHILNNREYKYIRKEPQNTTEYDFIFEGLYDKVLYLIHNKDLMYLNLIEEEQKGEKILKHHDQYICVKDVGDKYLSFIKYGDIVEFYNSCETPLNIKYFTFKRLKDSFILKIPESQNIQELIECLEPFVDRRKTNRSKL